jgi:hypothetical protein
MATLGFYATASQAKKWGTTYSETDTLSRSEAKKLRNAFMAEKTEKNTLLV